MLDVCKKSVVHSCKRSVLDSCRKGHARPMEGRHEIDSFFPSLVCASSTMANPSFLAPTAFEGHHRGQHMVQVSSF